MQQTLPRLISSLALSGLLLGLSACSEGTQRVDRPDVVLLLLDTTRADALGPFGGEQAAATPFLDSLAAESVVFENAWTGSTWTGPSSASVFSGLIPPRHGLVQNLWAQVGTGRDDRKLMDYMASVELVAIPDSIQTIPEHLKAAGYQTIGVATNPNICKEFGFTRGFDQYELQIDADSDTAVDLMLGFAEELDPARPRFFFLHLNDPHVPYKQRAPWCPHTDKKGCSDHCRYYSEVSFLDSQLERLFEALQLEEDAVIALVTDHGEEFNDHGHLFHRYSVHRELSRAALMVKAPGAQPRRTRMPAHQVDVLPTILERLDLAPPETRDGIALIPALDDAQMLERPLITHRIGGKEDRVLWALSVGRWRLIEELPDGELKLYDIEADPREQNDLAASQPEKLAELRARFAQLRSELVPVPQAHVRVDMTEHLTEELIKLGYAGDQH